MYERYGVNITTRTEEGGRPFCDRYATSKPDKRVLTNVTELLKSDEKTRLISLFFNDEKYNVSALSDFEYFSLLCTLLPQWSGTREGDLLAEELSVFAEKSLNFSTLSSENSVRELWEGANAMIKKWDGDYGKILEKNRVEKLYARERVIPSFPRVEKYNDGGDRLSLIADFRGLDFRRPDPYHASLAIQKSEHGERLSTEEAALLAAQALYLAVAEGGRETELRLLADGDGKTASEVVTYLSRLGVSGRVLIADDGTMPTDILLALTAQAGGSLSVRPELVLGKNDSAAVAYARLLALSARYPISLWRFGGVLSDAPLFFAGHRHMRRIVFRVLEATVPTADQRTFLLSKIFGEEALK